MYYRELSWPIVPLELSNSLFNYSMSANNTGTMANHFYHHYDLPSYASECFRNNLLIDHTYTLKIQRMFGVCRIPNHIDLIRNEVANFFTKSSWPRNTLVC